MAQNQAAENVAKQKDNDRLEHSAGGLTTRDDALDLGVPMLQGDASEPTGPEDALGVGPKRGDYSSRIGPDNYQPHEVTTASTADVADPLKPSARVVSQRGRVADRGDDKGVKGGTRPASDEAK